MKITKHQPDKDGVIKIDKAVTLLTMGLQENIVTIWAATDPLEVSGMPVIPLKFMVKKDGDELTSSQIVSKRYITSFINDTGVQHLFAADPPKIAPAHIIDKMPKGDNPTHDPSGGIK